MPPGRLPPGPRLPMPVQTALWMGRPVRFMERCAARYGDCFTLHLALSPTIVMVSDPVLVAGLFAAPPEVMSGGEENAVLEPLLGPRSVLMLDGAEHLRHRRLLLPFFTGERMRRHHPEIVGITEREVAAWPRGRPFPLLPRLRAITMEVILRVVFGLEEAGRRAEIRDLLSRLLGLGSSWLVLPWFQRDLGPGSPWGRFVRLRAEVDRALMAEIAGRRRAGTAGREDVLSRLLAGEEGGAGLTDSELRDELMTLLVAGHETTATALAWCFELLLRHPPLLARLRAQDETGETRLLEATVRETLRLRPPFRMVSRRLREPVPLGPWSLPAGTALAANVYLTHRAAGHLEPEAFRPERFLDAPHPGPAWIPFGGGDRRCLGAGFATFEMATVLRTVLGAVRLRPASVRPEPVALHAVVLVPRHGARVVAE